MTTGSGQRTAVYVRVNGIPLAEATAEKIMSIEVDQAVYLPGMFTLHLMDSQELELTDSETFDVGKKVEVLSKGQNSGEVTLIKGEITSIEPRFSLDGLCMLIVRGYDKSHRMTRGRKTQAFLQVKDSDIVKQLVGRAGGLQCDEDATSTVYDCVMQDNQSDWEFLLQRARRIGYWVYVREDKLYFKKAPKEEGPELEWGWDLTQFNCRMTGSGQHDKVTVQGWDIVNKQQVEGQKTSDTDSLAFKVGGKKGYDRAKSAFGSAEQVVVDRPVADASDADAVAQGLFNKLALESVTAECVCYGNPSVQVGTTVEIKAVGEKFSGKYRVTRAVHRYDQEDYVTEFNAGGLSAGILSELIAPQGAVAATARGAVVGIVTNNDDPDCLSRVRVKLPTLNDNEENWWARVAAPGAGNETGLHWMPEVGDQVLVVFEHDDINRPVVIGGLWSGKDQFPLGDGWLDEDGVVRRALVSRSGMKLVMGDKDGEEWLDISNEDDSIRIKLDQANTKVIVVSSGDVDVTADGKVTVENQGDVAVKSKGDVTLEGNKVTIKAQSELSLQGQSKVQIKSSGQASFEGTDTTVKGSAKLGVEGGAMCEIKGGLVKIN